MNPVRSSMAALAVLVLLSPALHAQTVTNVRAQQVTSGADAGNVEVLYDLSGFSAGAVVSIAFSSNGGESYTIIPASVTLTGNVGAGVTDGQNRRIVWDAAQTLGTSFVNSQMRAAVSALSAGTGDLAFRLSWGSCADLDLAVVEPSGEAVFFEHRTSATGGQLDIDANAYCQSCVSNPVENIYWPSGRAPSGTYTIYALNSLLCQAPSPVSFSLQILRGGSVIQTYTGSLTVETLAEYQFTNGTGSRAESGPFASAGGGPPVTLKGRSVPVPQPSASVTGYSNIFSLDTRACPSTPATPAFLSVPSVISAGSSFTVSWSATLGTDTAGRYEVEVAANDACSNPSVIATGNSWITVATEAGRNATYCVRVRAVSSQGCRSATSAPAKISVTAPPAVFAVISPAPALTVDRNASPPSDVEVVLRNIGSAAGSLSLTTDGNVFAPSPGSFSSVAPGQDAKVRLQFQGGVTSQSGLKKSNLIASWQESGVTKSLSTPVSLTVLEGTSTGSQGSRLQYLGTNEIYFRSSGTGNPPSQRVTLVNTGTVPVRLASRIGPGGGWLSVTGDFTSPLAPGASRDFTLQVDRTKRTADDGRPPLVTGLVFVNVDGNPEDSAYGQVVDDEPPVATGGSGRPLLTSNQFSLIIGSAVAAGGLGNTRFLSDGWIRNQGGTEITADLYFTPNNADGLASGDVKKSTVRLAPYQTYRLADLVNSLFQVSELSGQVEIRSSQLGQLSIRSTADSITTKDNVIARYGSEIPVMVSGQGVKRAGVIPAVKDSEGLLASGDEFAVLAGIRDPGAGFRTNLILAETSGKPATVSIRLYDKDGKELGRKSQEVKAYSKAQVNSSDTTLFPSNGGYDGGSVEVYPESGDGAVAVFATIIDNASQSYASRAGELFRTSETGSIVSRAGASTNAAGQPAYLPAAVRSFAANSSFYTSRLSLANLSRQAVTLTLTYIPDKRFGAPSIVKSVTIPARAQGPKAVVYQDTLADLFLLNQDSAGMIKFEGNLAPLSISSETSTPIDLNDASKGKSISAVNPAPGKPEGQEFGVWTVSSQEVIGTAASGASQSIINHPAIEEGFAFRTNLILAELSGQPVQVKARLAKSGSSGAALGEKTYNLDSNERLQINRVVRDILQVDTSATEFKDLELQIEATGGNGRVLALVTKIDNNPASKRADIFTLGTAIAGAPVGFGN